MAEYFVDPETGNDSNNGTSVSTPWKKIPGQTGANSVVAGDIINVKNGTTSYDGPINLTANNLIYQGYGISSNVLMLVLPYKKSIYKYTKRVVREQNVHEGLWTVYSTTTSPILSYGPRSSCIIQDGCFIGPNSSTTVAMGFSSSSAAEVTLKRSAVIGGGQGVGCYTKTLYIEDCLIKDISDDALVIGASINNGYRANTKDIVKNISIINPGWDEVSGLGDAIQTFASSDRFESSLLVENIYVNKPSKTKQSFVFTDCLGGLILRNFYIDSVPEGQAQILFSGVGSKFVVENGYIKNGCSNNAVFRYAGTQGIETGCSLSIKNIIVDAPNNSGFFTWGGSENAATIDGTVEIQHCSINGQNNQNLSFSGTVSFHQGSNITLGANAKGIVKNCIFSTQNKPSIRLPTGDANSAKWVIQNNAVSNPSFAIGSTNYSTVALFQAAHSYATNNITVTNTNLVNNVSLKHLGVFIDYNTDIENSSFNNPPSIGPFEYKYIRGVR